MAKPISAHVNEVMSQLDKVERLEGEKRTRAINNLYDLFRAIQDGAQVIAPLYPREDRLTPIVENYRVSLKPSDILDDPQDPLFYRYAER
jgi:DNA-directed RNA polymerase subunit F